jgi:excisionase family DNA binding protein
MQDLSLSQERYAFSVKEVAGFLSVSSRTIWTLVKNGELPSFRIGTRCLIEKAAIEKFIQARTQVAGRADEGNSKIGSPEGQLT